MKPKTILFTMLLACATLVLTSCHTAPVAPPSVTPSTTGTTTAVTPKPSFWTVMQSNLDKVNKVWNSQQVQQVVTELQPTANQALVAFVNGNGKISSAQGAALGLQAATSLVPSVTSNAELQTTLTQVMIQFAGDPKFKTPAQDIAKAVVNSLPANPTPAQMAQATSAAGTALSVAASSAQTPTPPPAVGAPTSA